MQCSQGSSDNTADKPSHLQCCKRDRGVPNPGGYWWVRLLCKQRSIQYAHFTRSSSSSSSSNIKPRSKISCRQATGHCWQNLLTTRLKISTAQRQRSSCQQLLQSIDLYSSHQLSMIIAASPGYTCLANSETYRLKPIDRQPSRSHTKRCIRCVTPLDLSAVRKQFCTEFDT
jgi:hypothetical protein